MIQPYLFFEGRCQQAIEFYQAALGAKIDMLMRYSDSPEPPPPGMIPPGSGDKVMHAALRIGDAVLLLSDGDCSGSPGFSGISLSLTAASIDDAQRKFSALAEAGKVQMPLGSTFFSPCFGMVEDRFGVCWMIIVQA